MDGGGGRQRVRDSDACHGKRRMNFARSRTSEGCSYPVFFYPLLVDSSDFPLPRLCCVTLVYPCPTSCPPPHCYPSVLTKLYSYPRTEYFVMNTHNLSLHITPIFREDVPCNSEVRGLQKPRRFEGCLVVDPLLRKPL